MSMIKILALTMTWLAFSACTSSGKRAIVVVDGKKNGAEGSENPKGEVIASSVPVAVLDEKEVRTLSQAPIGDLSYKFSYISFAKNDSLVFTSGKATLAFTGLPANQTGDMVLEIYEGTTLKLRGVATAVSLKAGQGNTIDLKVEAVAPGTPGSNGTTDVSINVTLDGTGSTPPGTVTPGTGTVTPGTGTVTPGTDPLLNWDGKSHQGNERWTIVAVP